MRRLICVAAFAVLGIQMASAVVCPTASLATYESLFAGTTPAGGCTIGALTFYDFMAPSGNGIANSPGNNPTAWGGSTNSTANITITPIIDANGTGFVITNGAPGSPMPVSVLATQISDLELEFIAAPTVPASGFNIATLYTELNGTAGASAVGGGTPGQDTLLEQVCQGTTLPPACGTNLDPNPLNITGPAPPGSTDVTRIVPFSPGLSSIAILKDIQATGNNGFATINFVKDQLTPEPSMIYITSAMVSIVLIVRRRRSKA